MLWLAAAHMTGKMRSSRMPVPHAVQNVLHRQGALLEELFHVGIVAFGDHFHQGLVGRLRVVGVLGRECRLPYPSRRHPACR